MRETLPGPHNIFTGQLSNGLRVWVYENFDSQTVAVQGYLPGGSIDERPEQTGLANLVATMVRRGSAQRSYDAINEIIESVGASFGFDAGRHSFGLDAYALAEDFDLVLELLGQSLRQPDFPQDELDKTRERLLAQLDEQKYNTRLQASLALRRMLYPPGHPYRTNFVGTETSLQSFTRQDLQHFYHHAIRPRGGVVVVVGAVSASQVMDRLEQVLGTWQHPHARPDDAVPAPPAISGPQVKMISIAGKQQSDILLGWPGIAVKHPDYFALVVCNSILGQFGLGGRLGQSVREAMGLAYSINSGFNVNRGAGTWRIQAGVNPQNVQRALDAIFEEVKRMMTMLVSPQELADVQRNLSGSLPLRLETNSGIAGNLLQIAWYEEPRDYLQTYADKVWAVRREDVLRVAQTYLDIENYGLAIAGPSQESA